MNTADEIRDAVIKEARTWLNTPFAHQQRIKGVGVDCANFLAELARASEILPDVEFERTYRQRESGEAMTELLSSYCYLIFDPPGIDLRRIRRADVLALCDEELREPNRPRHLIFVTALEKYLKGIHASARGVREHRLSLAFTRRIHSVWRLPMIVEADGESAWAFGTKVLFDLRQAEQ